MGIKQVTTILDVTNARHGPGSYLGELPGVAGPHDHLAEAGSLVTFFSYAGIDHPLGAPTEAELAQLRELADAARAMTAEDPVRLAARLEPILARYTYRLTTDGEIVPTAHGWHGFAAEAARGLVELVSERERLRTCANDDCGWLFIDESRNHSRQWCSMASCGSRAKMSRYRNRRRAGPKQPGDGVPTA